MNRLQGKVALVTGAARGIGRGIALRFAEEGALVGVLDRDEVSCQRVADEIGAAGGEAMALPCDITDEELVDIAVGRIEERFGTVTVLVNNAAVMPSGRLHETAPEDFDRLIAVNLKGTYLVSRAVLPGMLEARTGSILMMSSTTGILGLPGLAIYSATKAALIALARVMSTDYAAYGIRTNAIAPGTINTPMLEAFLEEQRPESRERLRREFDEMHPTGRIGTIEEVAQVAVFLASDEASFVTGGTYTVDGGLAVKGTQPQD